MRIAVLFALVLFLGACGDESKQEERYFVLASTTSPENCGLYAVMLPAFEKAHGIEVRTMPVGTGKAIRFGRDGTADAVFVHNKALEEEFVKDGVGVERLAVMKNEFIIVGPADDPAKIGPLKDGAEALRRIADARATFVSRGDDSGTHRRELAIWERAQFDPKPFSGTWYQEAGTGMGATLNIAVAKGAYCLTDSSTWGAFRNKGELAAVFHGDPKLQNPYTFIVCANSPRRAEAQVFADWLTGPEGQALIRDFKANGEQLFIPIAPKNN